MCPFDTPKTGLDLRRSLARLTDALCLRRWRDELFLRVKPRLTVLPFTVPKFHPRELAPEFRESSACDGVPG